MNSSTPDIPASVEHTRAGYNAVPYPDIVHYATNPLRTAALARLLGMDPAPPDQCRVLDIGCAAGVNIMAMAASFPRSSYVGVDLSQVHIEQGRALAAARGIDNITLHAADLMQLDESLGQFDYIIAHGLYSWVPAPVRDRILQVIRSHLAPNGVAYVSYNCLPGWHSFLAYREMLLYRTAHLTEPRTRIEAAKHFFKFLHDAWPAQKNYHGAFLEGLVQQLERDADLLDNERDSYIFHEYLEPVNDPVYIHQFLERVEAHGLQYVCDTDIHLDFTNGFEPGIAETIEALSTNLSDYQQYIDDVRMRAFRRTLLCHKEQVLSRALRVDRLRNLYIGAALRPPDDAPALHNEEREPFAALDGITFTTNHPLTKAALTVTRARYPETFRFEELVRAAKERMDAENDAPQAALQAQDMAELGANLLRMISSYSAMTEIWALPAHWATQPGARPRLSRWAQFDLQAFPFVTNLRHERVRLDALEAAVARLLDGTRDAAAICGALEPAIRAGTLKLETAVETGPDAAPDHAPADIDEAIAMLPIAVEERLRLLTIYALIEKPDSGAAQ